MFSPRHLLTLALFATWTEACAHADIARAEIPRVPAVAQGRAQVATADAWRGAKADIEIRYVHSLSKQEAKKRAAALAAELESKIGLVWHWDGDKIVFHAAASLAKGARGEMAVGDSDVRIRIDLPIALLLMRGAVESRVQAKLRQLL